MVIGQYLSTELVGNSRGGGSTFELRGRIWMIGNAMKLVHICMARVVMKCQKKFDLHVDTGTLDPTCLGSSTQVTGPYWCHSLIE